MVRCPHSRGLLPFDRDKFMNIKVVPAAKVRENFSEITFCVFKGDNAIVITHHDKPFAALVPIDLFESWLSATAISDVDLEKILQQQRNNKRTFRTKR